MNDSKSKHSQPFSFWLPVFYRPALLISITLHGLLFFLPLPDRSPTTSDLSPQPEETIALTDLLATPKPGAASPKPQMQASPSIKSKTLPTPKLVARATPPSIAQSSPPKPTAVPSPAPSATPTPTPTPEAIISPTPTITPAVQSEVNSDGVQTFFEQLAAATGVPVNPPSPDRFPDPSLYFDAIETTPTLKPNILRAVWMEGKTPEQVYISVLSSQLQSGNFQTEQKPDYGGGTVYQIKQGNSVWFLNLVPTSDGNGTIIVVWQQDPSRSIPSSSPSP